MQLDLATFATEPARHPDITEDDVVGTLGGFGTRLLPGQAQAVEAVLFSTNSSRIRNAAALALLDASYPHLEWAINGVLNRPATAGAAGTLLFCLMEADGRVDAAVLPNLIRAGSFEARSELLMLRSRGSVRFENDAEQDAIRAELADIACSPDAEAAEVASLALENLSALPQPDQPI